MNIYGVIMAGGGGTRFWPASRRETPKQLLNLTGKDIMVNETIKRVQQVVKPENTFIVTNARQEEQMAEVTSGLVKPEHILAEPTSRNTAACIGYAAFELVKKYGDGIMCIFPSDHYIKEEKEFAMVLESAIEAAQQGNRLVTIGICPSFPATGYGYIKHEGGTQIVKKVSEFVEKPDYETAKAYLESGEYSWNSGMFVWKASTILKSFERYLPRVYECLEKIADAIGSEREREVIEDIYPQIPSISIDYGIMERAQNVVMLNGNFGWNDVGSWDMLEVLNKPDEQGNVLKGEQVNIETKNCICVSNGRLVATVGVEDLIIVDTQDAVLVCGKAQAQQVKEIVQVLEKCGKSEYL